MSFNRTGGTYRPRRDTSRFEFLPLREPTAKEKVWAGIGIIVKAVRETWDEVTEEPEYKAAVDKLKQSQRRAVYNGVLRGVRQLDPDTQVIASAVLSTASIALEKLANDLTLAYAD